MKKGKSVKMNLSNSFKSVYGTVDSKNLKSLYINIHSWASPKVELENWNRVVCNLSRELKHTVYDSIDETIFIKNGYKLKIAGADKIEGADVIDLEVTTPSGKVSHRFYDSKTFLLAKVATTQEVPGRGSVTQQQFFKDYKSIGGVQIANEEVLDLGQFKLNVKYSDIKVNQGLKAEDLK